MLIAEKLRRRVRDEDGGIMLFIIMMFLTMIVAGGMAVDFMRHEAARSDLQNALDRGILAVTASSQTAIDKTDQAQLELLVGSYMQSRSFKLADMSLSVPVPAAEQGSTTRTFEAQASYDMPTYFLKLIGFPQILVRADSAASEGFFDTEVSLVLDVSSSMVWEGDGDRLENLKVGATAFVTNLLTNGQDEKTMISLVPFSGTTALPPVMAAFYDISDDDYFDYDAMAPNNANQTVCVRYDFGTRNINGGDWAGELGDFSDADIIPISYTGIPDADGNPVLEDAVSNFTRTHHFRVGTVSQYNPNDAALCPSANNAVLPFSNNETVLNDHIDGLTAQMSTATYIGIKWGTALLQPSAAPVLQGMSDAAFPGIDSSFADGYWPRDINQPEFASTKKVMVIISDGQNTNTFEMPEAVYRAGNPNDPSDDDDPDALYEYWDEYRSYRTCGRNRCWNNSYFDTIIDDANGGPDTDGDGIRDGNMAMREICDVAKSRGIEIYSIAYEVEVETARQNLEYCASTDMPGEHYFEGVNGAGLTDVFDKIAAGVTKLRLVN